MVSYIYICGRGYSGSTMLDAMLGDVPEIVSVGELVSGIKRYEELCSCGDTFQQCHFWQAVRKNFEHKSHASWNRVADQLMQQAHLKRLPATLFFSSSSIWAKARVAANNDVFYAIAKTSANKHVVDSSKEVTRAFFLIKHHSNAKVIHLVKNPVTVLESTYYRLASGSGFRFLRKQFRPKRVFWPALTIAAAGWVVGNVLAELIRLNDRKRVYRLRYEDIVESPERSFDMLEKFLDIDLTEIKYKVVNKKAFDVGHNIGGNHMRHAKKFIFDPSKSSRGGLPAKYVRLVRLLCYPLMKKYGYIEKS